eukprot:SAG31_NODE_1076_length_10037_cov_8.357818_5_plen_67_part_00
MTTEGGVWLGWLVGWLAVLAVGLARLLCSAAVGSAQLFIYNILRQHNKICTYLSGGTAVLLQVITT